MPQNEIVRLVITTLFTVLKNHQVSEVMWPFGILIIYLQVQSLIYLHPYMYYLASLSTDILLNIRQYFIIFIIDSINC